MSEKIFYKVARLCVKAAVVPFPVNQHVVKIIENLITEKQARFILNAFKKSWISKEEIKIKTQMDKDMIKEMLDELTHIGILINLPHPRTGVPHYKIVAFFPGLLEFTLMRGEKGEKQKKLAQLWEKVFDTMSEGTQINYDKTVNMLRQYNFATDRVVPVEKEIAAGQDTVVPREDLKQILEIEENIGVAICYCRHQKDLIDKPCERTDLRENCILLGKTAQFCIEYDFAKPISKEKALELLKLAEDDGLIHKIFHTNLNPQADIDGICSCCPCCCGTLSNYFKGAIPAMSYSSYLANLTQEKCIGCGICVDICPIKAIELENEIGNIDKSKCLGCGLCSHHCPEEAIQLERTGERLVFIPPPKIQN
jgi:Pyruvate/2-oxoacid:ferredoxin oxidoreductase delta subunit